MDVFEYAMKMELDGEAYFREHMNQVSDKNAAYIIQRLAEEEHKHYEIIKDFRGGADAPAQSEFVATVKNLFQQMKDGGETFAKADARTVDILQKALAIEDRAGKYYGAELEKGPDERTAGILTFLKKEEDRHYGIIANMIDFFEKPQTWVEQAEFNYLEEY